MASRSYIECGIDAESAKDTKIQSRRSISEPETFKIIYTCIVKLNGSLSDHSRYFIKYFFPFHTKISLIFLKLQLIRKTWWCFTRVFSSVHVPDVAEGGVRFLPIAHFHDLFSVAGVNSEMRQLQIQRLLGVARGDNALRFAGHEVSYVLVIALDRMIVSHDPVQIVAALFL